MNKAFVMAVSALAAIPGCVTRDALTEQMAGWQHQRVDIAVETWGAPDERSAFEDGVLLTWRDRRDAGPSVAPWPGTGVVVCERMLAVGPDGRITGWRWRGDACPSLAEDPASRTLVAAARPRD